MMFTTMGKSADREELHTNTIINLAGFMPILQPVLFTDDVTDPDLIQRAVDHGWLTLPAPLDKYNSVPLVEEMFKTAAESFPDADFIGMSNADIVFDYGLLDTLNSLMARIGEWGKCLIVGARYNVNPKRVKNTVIGVTAMVTKVHPPIIQRRCKEPMKESKSQKPMNNF